MKQMKDNATTWSNDNKLVGKTFNPLQERWNSMALSKINTNSITDANITTRKVAE